jgi:pyridoxamine 5'-phosphate oxidase
MALSELDVHPNPTAQFTRWYDEAVAAVGEAADHMVVATADAEGRPSARVVLLRGFDDRGLCFYTNHESRKARELATRPAAAIVLHWAPLHRQVRATGAVTRLDRVECERYWQNRPRPSRLSAWASRQSEPVASRDALEAGVHRIAERFGDGDVPLPPFWGGYRLAPADFEFWEHRDDRLHDRVRYRRAQDGWTIDRLSP